MRHVYRVILTLAAATGLTACGLACPAPERPIDEPDPPALHLYVQEAYEAFPPGVVAAVGTRYDELVGAGMDTARHLFDWRDLEPEPGVYDTQHVIDEMDARAARGITQQFCNLVVLDSLDPVAPQYIHDLVESGVPWDDPRITDAFADMLDVFMPLMQARGMYLLGLSNEPGGYYEDFPGEAASFAGFIEAAVAHAHSLDPDLPCTVVFAGDEDPAIPALMPLLDVASFNQYFYTPAPDPSCTLAGYTLELYHATPPSEVGPLLDRLIAAAQGKRITIQEIGQASGWNDQPQTLGPLAGLENQRACFEALKTALDERRAHFWTVCIWTLNDHTVDGGQWLADALYAENLPACYVDNILEIFGPTGLVRSDATASKKPAFDAVKDAVAYFAAGNAKAVSAN